MGHADRHAQLVERYGRAEVINAAGLVRALGLRGELHPHDAYACRYPSLAAAEAYAASNREHYDHAVHGPYETEVGVVTLIDFRPALARIGADVVDPSLPDDAKRS